MKLLASISITLLLALVGVATWNTMTASAQTISAYSVTNITRTVNGAINGVPQSVYRATLSITNSPKTATPEPGTRILKNGDELIITTSGCDHLPAKGVNGIITGRVGSADRSLLFSDGATCKVTNVVPAN